MLCKLAQCYYIENDNFLWRVLGHPVHVGRLMFLLFFCELEVFNIPAMKANSHRQTRLDRTVLTRRAGVDNVNRFKTVADRKCNV